MRRRGVRRILWGAVVLFLTIVAVFLNAPAQPRAPQPFRSRAGVIRPGYAADGTLEKPSPADIAGVEKQLDIRAHAVLDGDRAAFMGVVDTDRSSFATRQRTVWANTRKLPFATLSYSYDGPIAPDHPLSTPSFLVRVTTTYELRGYDASPVQVDGGFTFVEQHGTWKLAAVNDADRQLRRSALPVPWEGRAIDTYGDGDYLAVVDRGAAAMARRLVALCHRGSRASGRLLGVRNTRPTVIVATSHEPGFKRFVGIDALAVTYPLSGPDGVTPGWRVVVNPHRVAEVAASPVVLPHELTHLATQDYLACLPTWLVEGSAEYVGWDSQGGLPAAMREDHYDWRLSLSDQLPTSRSFYDGGIRLDYLEGMALVTWIEEHRGRGAVLALMRAYEDAGGWDVSFDPDATTPAILRNTIGMTPAALAHAAYAELNAAVKP